ncbi:MAG: hypothetical protein P4L96_15560, partial [Rhodoferax sp.]|nr:hypothetical protein [Rhodoferax sp.]
MEGSLDDITSAVQQLNDHIEAEEGLTIELVSPLTEGMAAWLDARRPLKACLGVAGDPTGAPTLSLAEEVSEEDADAFWAAFNGVASSDGDAAHRKVLRAAAAVLGESVLTAVQFHTAVMHLTWAAIPGGAAYGVTDVHLLANSLCVLERGAASALRGDGAGAGPSKKGKGKGAKAGAPKPSRKRRAAPPSSDSDDEPAASQAAVSDGEDGGASPQEACIIPFGTVAAGGRALLRFLTSASLLDEDVLLPCVQALAALIPVGVCDPAQASVPLHCVTALLACGGEAEATSRKLCRAVKPLLCGGWEAGKHLPADAHARVRTSVLSLLSHMLTSTATAMSACGGVSTLAQHLCVVAPARAEARAQLRDVITSIIALLPPLYQRHFVRFLSRAVRNKRAPLRLLCVDLCAALVRGGGQELLAGASDDQLPQE